MDFSDNIRDYIENVQQEALDLLIDLAKIPAPSHHEELRAQFCLNWLKAHGAVNAYIDKDLNVIYPVGVSDSNQLYVYMAHSDVVFPDTSPLPLRVDGNKLYCPGVGDDTANVIVLLMAAKYIAEHRILPKDCGVLLVINSCEEGLGNLKGCRRIISDFGSRIREFVSFDSGVFTVIHKAVGSRRYQVDVHTEGGHSYSCFGKQNAIACLADFISDLYKVTVPAFGKTTYNVGTIDGGTSVNTIAQNARMLYEFRSDDRRGLEFMENSFRQILSNHQNSSTDITVALVGDRPCSADVDPAAEEALASRAARAVLHHYNRHVNYGSGSTDCNIPLSLGIPAICVGCVDGDGAHTREEYILIDSIKPGLAVAFELILHHF